MKMVLGYVGGAAVIAAGMMAGSASAQTAKPAAFGTCAVCHKVAAGQPQALGPNLFRVGGRKAGTSPGYKYSPAMAGSKLTWDRATLIRYITNPRGLVPGTKMVYAGQKNPQVAAQIADYVLSLK